jgi:hypothetical protein
VCTVGVLLLDAGLLGGNHATLRSAVPGVRGSSIHALDVGEGRPHSILLYYELQEGKHP